MRWFGFIFTLLGLTILQFGEFSRIISIGSISAQPEFLIVLMLIYVCNSNRYDSIIIAFSAGFMYDLGHGILGPGMLTIGVLGTLLAHIREALVLDNYKFKAILAFILSAVILFCVYLITIIKTDETLPNLFTSVFANALYSAIITPVLWWAFQKIGLFQYPNRKR